MSSEPARAATPDATVDRANHPANRERVTLESFDLNGLRRTGSEQARQQMAERLHRVWRPLFVHLHERDAGFLRAIHIDDDTAAWKRIWFYRRAGRDLGAIIGRVHDHQLGGRAFSRITMNAGFDPSLIGGNVGGSALAKTLVAALCRAPLRPLFVVDTMSSSSALAAMMKAFPEVRPGPDGPIDDHLWAYALEVAPALRCTPVEGKIRGVVLATCVVSPHVTSDRASLSANAARAAAWFETHVAPGQSVLVVCPLGLGYAARRLLWWSRRALMTRLGRQLHRIGAGSRGP